MPPHTERRNSWRDPRWLFVVVWLVFLAYPISGSLAADRAPWRTVLGIGLIATFAVVYLLAARQLLVDSIAAAAHGPRWTASLAVLVLLTFVITGEPALGLMPFFLAIVAVGLPLTLSIGVIVVSVAVALGAYLLSAPVDPQVVVIMAAVSTTLLGVRVLAARAGDQARAEARQRELDEQQAVVAERERVARDVHDILGHSLTVISVKSELAQRLIEMDPDRSASEMAEVNALARTALAEVRSTVGDLRSPDLPSTLAAANSALAAADIAARLPDPDTVDPTYTTLFAWVVREAVTNVVRHSDAQNCEIIATADRISIRDDGKGMGTHPHGHGLHGLSERITAAGGEFIVHSDDGGTRIDAVMGEHE